MASPELFCSVCEVQAERLTKYTDLQTIRQAVVYRFYQQGKKMLKLEEVQKRLEDMNLSKVAVKAGLTYDTVWRVANDKKVAVSYETVRKLSDYLEGK